MSASTELHDGCPEAKKAKIAPQPVDPVDSKPEVETEDEAPKKETVAKATAKGAAGPDTGAKPDGGKSGAAVQANGDHAANGSNKQQQAEDSADDAAAAAVVDDSSPGEVLWCGTTKWQLLHDKKAKLPNLYAPHRMESLIGLRISRVFSGPAACHVVLVTSEGQALTFGRNHMGQLGVGDRVTSVQARPVEALRNIRVASAACGRSHTLFLTARGEVFACGDNRNGQCGLGNVANSKDPGVALPRAIAHTGRRVAQVAAGGDFSLLVDSAGLMLTCGHPEYGQLGHGNDNQYFEGTKLVHKMEPRPVAITAFVREEEGRGGRAGAKSIIEGVRVVSASCGPSHCACIDSEGRLWTWGFGGYGRLGHNSTKDELRPRLVNYFSATRQRVESVSCGGAYTIATTSPASPSSAAVAAVGVAPPIATYFWGQQKSSGEASMYPKVQMDLSGWSTRRVSAGNRSCAVLADASCITWGPSPTFGELGHGEMVKSSARPMVCKALEKVRITDVAMGYAQCVFLVPCGTSQDAEEKLAKFPVCKDK